MAIFKKYNMPYSDKLIILFIRYFWNDLFKRKILTIIEDSIQLIYCCLLINYDYCIIIIIIALTYCSKLALKIIRMNCDLKVRNGAILYVLLF